MNITLCIVLLLGFYIVFIRSHKNCKSCRRRSVVNTYNEEYSKLYDTVWYDRARYKGEVRYISKNIGIDNPTRILDLGCGTGNHLKLWKDKWPSSNVKGMDLSLDQISKAREKHPDVEITHGSYLNSNIWEKNSFDLILCMYDASQYTDDVDTVFQNIYKWLKPGGVYVFHGIDPRRLEDGCDETASTNSLPVKPDRKGHCNVLYPGFVYSSWWSKSIFSNWVRYNETFYKTEGNGWPRDWDVSKKVEDNVPIGMKVDTKTQGLMTNGHRLFLLTPSQMVHRGKQAGFIRADINPSNGITNIHDQGSEEYFIFFKK
jgi:ubiquinone/menaquinone biosynthesis C-methylase UbiE